MLVLFLAAEIAVGVYASNTSSSKFFVYLPKLPFAKVDFLYAFTWFADFLICCIIDVDSKPLYLLTAPVDVHQSRIKPTNKSRDKEDFLRV